jgi:hypothetical protein
MKLVGANSAAVALVAILSSLALTETQGLVSTPRPSRFASSTTTQRHVATTAAPPTTIDAAADDMEPQPDAATAIVSDIASSAAAAAAAAKEERKLDNDDDLEDVEFPPPLSTLDRMKRAATFWSTAIPIVANYYGLIGNIKLQELLGSKMTEEEMEVCR